MAQKTYKQIQEEADRMFGKGASKEKFEWRRKQQEASGLEQEKRKRGGVAGGYDRNKKLIGTAATAAGYFFGGPAGAAITRGAIQGFDRPGEGGIGFDVGRAAKGAAEGYAAGKVAQFGQSGLQRLMGGAPSAGATTTGGYSQEFINAGRGAGDMAVPPAGAGGATAAASGAAKAPGAMSKMLGGIKEYAPVIQAGTGLASDVLGQQAERGVAERKLDIEEQLRREEQARRDRLAQLLMPMFQSQVQQYGQQRQG